MTSGESFHPFARQGAFPQEYFAYFKEKQRSMAEKDQPSGHVDIFQTRPSIMIKLCAEEGRAMDRLIFHVDVNRAYLFWEAARRVKNGGEWLDIKSIYSCGIP